MRFALPLLSALLLCPTLTGCSSGPKGFPTPVTKASVEVDRPLSAAPEPAPVLGAGDSLGQAVFAHYAAVVRAGQDQPALAAAAELPSFFADPSWWAELSAADDLGVALRR